MKRIEDLMQKGYFEVVLSGINLGRYGLDLDPPSSLSDLIGSIDNPRSTKRLRLSSIEPTEFSDELLSLVQNSKRICHHLHIPLQSGDDEVLARMNRDYGSRFFLDLIQSIVTKIPGISIGVDVLVGFPGETEKAFDGTCALIEQLPVAYLHVFPFSLQKGTAAEGLSDPVDSRMIKKRAQVMREIGQTKRMSFYEKALGSTMEVLIEGKRDTQTGLLRGLTENYIPVHVEGPNGLFNQLAAVKLTKIEQNKVLGELLSAPGQR
jgi:threonylcarbamoyladenosine tRNA methylthiotransferase MtaB